LSAAESQRRIEVAERAEKEPAGCRRYERSLKAANLMGSLRDDGQLRRVSANSRSFESTNLMGSSQDDGE